MLTAIIETSPLTGIAQPMRAGGFAALTLASIPLVACADSAPEPDFEADDTAVREHRVSLSELSPGGP
jgi:hypothetical protein